MKQRKKVAMAAAYRVGQYLLRTFRAGSNVCFSEKSPLDLVSEADKVAEKMLIENIQTNFPADGILAEESGFIKSLSGYSWVIDPLDGTHNFLKGFTQFSTAVALQKDGEVILGICYFPVTGEFFLAEKGGGAFLSGFPIHVSPAANFKGEMFYSDSAVRHKPEEILRDIERFCQAGCRLRVCGSSSFAFTRVAMGQASVTTNRSVKPWDVAASALLVEEAGGTVTDDCGNPWRIDSPNLLATNGILHRQALLLFQK